MTTYSKLDFKNELNNFAIHNRLCKDPNSSSETLCTGVKSSRYGEISVSKSENFIYVTGIDGRLGTTDDLIWYEGSIYVLREEHVVNSFWVGFLAAITLLFMLKQILKHSLKTKTRQPEN